MTVSVCTVLFLVMNFKDGSSSSIFSNQPRRMSGFAGAILLHHPSRRDTESEDMVTVDSLRETGIRQSQHCRVKIRLSLTIHKPIWSNCKRRGSPDGV
ncbi:uncharacterized protein P174DRAFT_437845 [Aspergillus novofumigatus IBT 16806]|uniref:Secreted protein n=1 Tax=Aspergillus novofumigatus (strain IBT 16806) TaxID=1392255 RepID=A0A2I1CP41_ASPN1|nr:uncharacterized protein P174DRAFT_437845 [Aspergillus novofumigatus IBT 16806]PKX99397.1 hypothetical protein P174DRAFT_437845 [Aspergillus novofumigatus IBT 16806]